MDEEADGRLLQSYKEVAFKVAEAIEQFEDEVVEWDEKNPGKHAEAVQHHIHDHLGWAEHLLGQELKRLDHE